MAYPTVIEILDAAQDPMPLATTQRYTARLKACPKMTWQGDTKHEALGRLLSALAKEFDVKIETISGE